jgi:chemotaxis protein MotB
MKNVIYILAVFIIATSCVSSKRYKELLSQSEDCNTELKKYKSMALDNEASNKDLNEKIKKYNKDIAGLIADTTSMGKMFRDLQLEYDKSMAVSKSMEGKYNSLQKAGAQEAARLQRDLESKIIEVQRKEDALLQLERELNAKQRALEEREKRVKELEEVIAKQEQARRALLDKINQALRGFKDKGLSVVEKNGKIYVSLEAKLLFSSGSTSVDDEGKSAIIKLAEILETQSGLDIIVEGHTDTDALKRNSHPKNNWELSVLRATSVVEIMLANSKMDSQTIAASGRSEFHPVDVNDKAKNRRIEVIITPDLTPLYEAINEK